MTPAEVKVSGPAARLGLTPAEYLTKRAAGLKWCHRCGVWHDRAAFAKNSDRADGLNSECRESMKTRLRDYRSRSLTRRNQ